jgi:hypothetical protein
MTIRLELALIFSAKGDNQRLDRVHNICRTWHHWLDNPVELDKVINLNFTSDSDLKYTSAPNLGCNASANRPAPHISAQHLYVYLPGCTSPPTVYVSFPTWLSLPFVQRSRECVILSRTPDNRKILKILCSIFILRFILHSPSSFVNKISPPLDHNPRQQRLDVSISDKFFSSFLIHH